MPTTAEVETRLRRIAEACEPIVESLVTDELPATDLSVHGGPRRGGWLAAAAVLVVLAVGAGVVAVSRDGNPGGEVRATTPDEVDTTTAVAPTGPAYTVPFRMTDGTSGFLQIPGDDRWRQVEWLVRGRSDSGAELTITVIASDGERPSPQVGSRPDGTPLVTWQGAEHLAVEAAGWIALVPTVDLAEDEIDAIGDQLGGQIGALGPTIGSGPGLHVAEAGARFRSGGGDASLVAWRVRDGGDACPEAPEQSATVRCLGGGRLVVDARGAAAQDALAGTTAVLDGDDPVVQHVPLAFADGTRLIVSLPGSSAFRPGGGTAELAIDGERLGYPVFQLHETTAERFAAEEGATFTPLVPTSEAADPVLGTWRVDAGTGRSWLLVGGASWGAGWVAALPTRVGDGDLVPPEVVDRLAEDLRVTPTGDGLVDLGGPGITVGQATRSVEAQTGSFASGIEVRVGPGAEQACRTGAYRAEHQRCFADGRVLVLVDPLVESPGQPLAVDLDTVEVEITDGGGPRRTDPPR